MKDSIDALQKNATTQLLLQYGLMIVGASLFAGIFRFMIRQTIIVVSREIEFDVRGDFWKHIQRLPLRYFQNTSTGIIQLFELLKTASRVTDYFACFGGTTKCLD